MFFVFLFRCHETDEPNPGKVRPHQRLCALFEVEVRFSSCISPSPTMYHFPVLAYLLQRLHSPPRYAVRARIMLCLVLCRIRLSRQ